VNTNREKYLSNETGRFQEWQYRLVPKTAEKGRLAAISREPIDAAAFWTAARIEEYVIAGFQKLRPEASDEGLLAAPRVIQLMSEGGAPSNIINFFEERGDELPFNLFAGDDEPSGNIPGCNRELSDVIELFGGTGISIITRTGTRKTGGPRRENDPAGKWLAANDAGLCEDADEEDYAKPEDLPRDRIRERTELEGLGEILSALGPRPDEGDKDEDEISVIRKFQKEVFGDPRLFAKKWNRCYASMSWAPRNAELITHYLLERLVEVEDDPRDERARQIVISWLQSRPLSQRAFCASKGIRPTELVRHRERYFGALKRRLRDAAPRSAVKTKNNGHAKRDASTGVTKPPLAAPPAPVDVIYYNPEIVVGIDNVARELRRTVANVRRMMKAGKLPVAGMFAGEFLCASRKMLRPFRKRKPTAAIRCTLELKARRRASECFVFSWAA
jgi:hypothetical protein